jgi:hypothetical protein
MDDLFQAARDVEAAVADLRFCFIGGIAVIRWGVPRVTRDLDVAVLAGFGSERPIIDRLLARFPGRIPDAAGFAEENRVVLLRTPQGIEIDVSLAALPFEEEMIRRATRFSPVEGVYLTTCSAEDLVVLKAFAARPRDWADVESILHRQERLDWAYIDAALAPLAAVKPETPILATLAELRALQSSR